jgi:hypothetical protein
MTDDRSPTTSTEKNQMSDTEPESSPIAHAVPYPTDTVLGFPNTTGSTALNVLISIITLPIQGLALLLLARGIQQLVLCIDEVYEATGRRSRSKFVAFPWVRVALGVLLLAAYHVGLFKLTVKSWKALRRSNVGGG